MENNKTLSVIIVNYKSEAYLQRCLSSLYQSLGAAISLEVIIVNNSPAVNLAEIQKNFPEIKVLVNAQNGGFGQGNNVGARAAQGKYLLLLNPDTEILGGSLPEMLREFERNPELGAVGGCLLTEDRKIQEWSGGSGSDFLGLG